MTDSNFRLRYAVPEDAGALLDIYAPYITGTTVTFEYEVPSVEEFAGRIRQFSETYPYIICEDTSGRAIGYAYAHRFQSRAAYQWGAECSVYVRMGCTSSGVGRALYSELLRLLTAQNVQLAYAAISTPNDPSFGFHSAFGFEQVGRWNNAGYKFGTWHDILWYEKRLNPLTDAPAAVIPCSALPEEVRKLPEEARRSEQ